MERCFIVTNESKFLQNYLNYSELYEAQRKFICKFFEEKGIETNKYLVSGDGHVNVPFPEHYKKDIRLYIVPTTNDKEKFGKWLKAPIKNGLCGFKKNSVINKEFSQKCIDEQIVINLFEPKLRDYFESLGLNSYKRRFFEYKETYYLEVESEYLRKDDTPKGLIEIKRSEFFKIIEEVENNKQK